MGAISFTLPREELRFLRFATENSERIFSEVVKAGGQAAYENVKANVPASFRKSEIMHCLKMTRIYRTSYDNAINVKIGFYGYFTNHLGKRTPAPLVANVFEYGSSKFPKQPFFRFAISGGKVIRTMGQTFRSFVRSGELPDKGYSRADFGIDI
jgi:hypothetical protein